MYRNKLAFIVEGHGEFEGIPSIVGKSIGYFSFPIHNAKGIGNITKNIGNEILLLTKATAPENVIIVFDSKDAVATGEFASCLDLKHHVQSKIDEFLDSQANGTLILPNSISVVIAHQTYDTWLISDLEGLKSCDIVDENKIQEKYSSVDEEVISPNAWIKEKLINSVDPKNRRHRKKLVSALNPHVGRNFSRSLDKFIREVEKYVA